MMDKKSFGSTIEGTLLGIITMPIWLPIVLLMLVGVLAIPFVRCYGFVDKLAKKISINLSKLVKLGLSIAFLGACAYGIYFVVPAFINKVGTLILLVFLILMLILLIGYFGLIESLKMVRYPNILELTRKKTYKS